MDRDPRMNADERVAYRTTSAIRSAWAKGSRSSALSADSNGFRPRVRDDYRGLCQHRGRLETGVVLRPMDRRRVLAALASAALFPSRAKAQARLKHVVYV